MTGGSIYRIPFPNGKWYIGLTMTSLEQRKKEHKYSAKSGNTRYLYNALRKYKMVDILELIEIDTADTLEELCEKEIRYIKDYNSYYMNNNGYNMTYGGEGANGYIHTEEDNKKNSKRIKRYYEEHPDAGKEHSEKLKLHYKEHPDAIQRMSEISTEYWKNPEAKVKMSETITRYYNDPEAKKKCSEAQKKRFENPDERQKNSERRKLHFKENPDAREKILDGKGKNKPFDVCTLDGTFIKTFTYQFEAIEYLQKERHINTTIKIGEVLKGRRKSSAGFVFTYK